MKEIQLTQGQVALVDDEDFESLNQHKWYAKKHGNTFYAVREVKINGKAKKARMHCLVMNGKGIDHVDRNGLNNQRSNLRFCTASENGMNRRKQKNTSSIYKGVSFSKSMGKWKAQIQINGRNVYLGYLDSEIEAARAYNKKAIEFFREFANLNIIDNE